MAAGQKRSIPLSGSRECFSALLDMLPDPHRQCLFGKPQLIGLLEIHPEFSSCIEEGRQPHRRISRDAMLPFDDGRDPIRRNFEGFGESIGINRRV